jgi:signal transduction histidine kinase
VSEVDPPDTNSGERTEIIYGTENVIKFSTQGLSTVEKRVDVCGDYSMPSVILASEPVRKGYFELNRRGVRIRWITDITKENASSCKEIMKIAELRHLDGVKGGFVVADEKVYVATAILQMKKPVTQLIYSNVKAIVEQQQYMFNTLWDKAIPSKQRIREIEEEVEREFIETIRDPYEILDIGYKLIKAAKDEILIIFHTANAFLRQHKAGRIDLLVANVDRYRIRVKILVPIENKIRESVERLEKINGIQVRNIEPTMQTRVTILVVDRKYSLVVELMDDSKENSEEAIGLATYSNSRSTVSSYASIFETLWRQSELREELFIRSMAQKDFIKIAAHELRNPIQPILGLSEVLLQAESIFDSSKNNLPIQKEMVEIIVRNARRLQRLTEDILDITRIEGKTLKLNKHNFILVRTIRGMIKDYTSEASNKNINISFSASKELDSVSILADEERIKQVISNLLDNAIKFTEGAIFVTVEISPKNNQVLVNSSTGGNIYKAYTDK